MIVPGDIGERFSFFDVVKEGVLAAKGFRVIRGFCKTFLSQGASLFVSLTKSEWEGLTICCAYTYYFRDSLGYHLCGRTENKICHKGIE